MRRALGLIQMVLLAALSSQGIAASKALQEFRSDAPADTVFYLEGSVGKLPNLSGGGAAESIQIEQAFVAVKEALQEVDQPSAKFIRSLLEDFTLAMEQHPNELAKYYGLSAKQEYALYLNGLSPILKLAVDSADPLKTKLIKHSKEAELAYRTEQWLGNDVMIWEFDAKYGLEFAVVMEKKYVTMGVFFSSDSEDDKYLRLGLTKAPQSLASGKIIADLQKQYDFTDTTTGFLSFIEAAKIGLGVEGSRGFSDLQRLQTSPGVELSKVCQGEYLKLIQSVPRLVYGYEQVKQSGNNFNLKANAIIELTNDSFKSQLIKLNGHISDSALSSNGQIASVALGIDTTQLAPVITQLWDQFINTEFKCEELAASQLAAQESNPAAIALFTAMAQGIQGISINLYDLVVSNMDLTAIKIDALITASAAQPELLTTLLSSIPQLQGVRIPSDGTSAPISSLGLPENLTPKATIKGNHLAIYMGNKAENIVSKLSQETLNHSGIFGLFFDYQKVYKLAETVFFETPELTETMVQDACIETFIGMQSFAAVNAQLAYRQKFSDRGIENQMNMSIDSLNTTNQGSSILGDFKLEQMSDGCQWQPAGVETIKSSGTGTYKYLDESESCSLWKNDYLWTQNGYQIEFKAIETQSRNSCEEELAEDDLIDYRCKIVSQDNTGFVCLFTYEDEDYVDLFKYTRH